jgi:hypothetical protein
LILGFERETLILGFEHKDMVLGFERDLTVGFELEYDTEGTIMPHVVDGKQPAEKFFIWGGITNVISTGEAIVIENCSVTAVDSEGTDVTSTFLTAATLAVYDTTKIRVQLKSDGGTEALSPYKVTFIIATDGGNEWEVDVFVVIKDQ